MAPAKSVDAKTLENLLTSRFSSFEEKLKSFIKDEAEKQSNSMKVEFNEMKKAMTFFEAKCEEMMAENKELKKEVSALKKENSDIKAKLVATEKCAQNAMVKVNEVDNHLRLNNIELHGVSLDEKEDASKVAMRVIKIVDPSATEKDLELVRRVGNPTKKDGSRRQDMPILVKLRSRDQRMHIMRNRKQLAGKDFNAIGVKANKVFINENLTSFSKSLFYQANILRKNNGWKYIWTTNGSINLRKNDESRVLFVRSEEDLHKITK